ncbi:MAG: glycosyltransferase [Lachnospiraceae bacterium]
MNLDHREFDHTFAICAYGDSPYLESCIRSLVKQTVPSRIILCTSTPSPYIASLAETYGITVFEREGKSDIQEDWNFAYAMAGTNLVTIAHQDDLYHKDYGAQVRKAWEKYPDTTVFMSDAVIIKNGKLQKAGKVSLVKKALRLPLRIPCLNHITGIKRLALMFGNPVICPSCTYNKAMLGTPLFHSDYKFALDWDTMWELASRPGRFICREWPLMYYRVHDGATTKACIKDHRRVEEETKMFEKIWPKPIVRLLMRFYQGAYGEYDS